MPKTRELTEAERGQIVILRSQGMSISAIARTIKCVRSTVRATIQRHQETGSYANRPKSGRKPITTQRQDRILHRLALRNRQHSSKDLVSELSQRHGVTVSARTVRRRLLQYGLRGCKARRKPRLSQEQKHKRLVWARDHENWTVDQWAEVMWTDESNIEVCIQNNVN